jgi:hypothetical protein
VVTSVRFQVLTAANVKMAAFLDIAPCSLVEVDRRFRGASCLHHLNVGLLQRDYTTLYLRRLPFSRGYLCSCWWAVSFRKQRISFGLYSRGSGPNVGCHFVLGSNLSLKYLSRDKVLVLNCN